MFFLTHYNVHISHWMINVRLQSLRLSLWMFVNENFPWQITRERNEWGKWRKFCLRCTFLSQQQSKGKAARFHSTTEHAELLFLEKHDTPSKDLWSFILVLFEVNRRKIFGKINFLFVVFSPVAGRPFFSALSLIVTRLNRATPTRRRCYFISLHQQQG